MIRIRIGTVQISFGSEFFQRKLKNHEYTEEPDPKRPVTGSRSDKNLDPERLENADPDL